ncbi:YdgH/BhsA/McbA-like domain containing protein [Mangrovibacter phragmitis]|uniref:YdgH/BhsA/McbA-like domain containing protein n=1 Tax=Mangrovibacter phragmitis TaxID=1691903 RepID=UPI00336A32AB
MKNVKTFAIITLALASLSGSVYASGLNSFFADHGDALARVSPQPQEISQAQAVNHQKIGTIAVTQQGFSMDNTPLKHEAAEQGGKYYVITGSQGQPDHKTIEATLYK